MYKAHGIIGQGRGQGELNLWAWVGAAAAVWWLLRVPGPDKTQYLDLSPATATRLRANPELAPGGQSTSGTILACLLDTWW